VEADHVSRYDQDTEAAVYFCCLEALQNVAKYAGASHATIRLNEDHGSLTFEVTDDGQGFDPTATGYGTACRAWPTACQHWGRARSQVRTGQGTTSRDVPARSLERWDEASMVY